MKNIHILPTDKPSRLVKQKYDELNRLCLADMATKRAEYKRFNIYITSDEDINENDYIITKDGRLFQVSYLLSKDLQGASKVILTTDQDLIKDGVQAIDDEFLEWFVKNPSCERVEVINDTYTVGEMSKLPLGIRNHKYKIIISKEKPKQETLEELAKNYANYNEQTNKAIQEAVKFGYKLGLKRSYSDEEVIDLLKALQIHYLTYNERINIDKWFEQFKKK